MKIGIVGAHRVGKTTLVEALQDRLPGYESYAEPYYELEESGYLFSDTPDADDFIRQFNFCVKTILRSGHNALFDRCMIDLLAYLHAVDPLRDVQSLFAVMEETLTAIDLLVFVPVEEPDIIPVQSSDLPELRSQVNEILDNWMQGSSVKMIEVHGTSADRLNQVLNKIHAL